MSEAAAYFPPIPVREEGPGPNCEVCGKAGQARVCGCDGADLICHLATCETVCAKCAVRAQSRQAAASPAKPQSHDLKQPCILEVRKGCPARSADATAALAAYAELKIERHGKESFAADVLFGHFESIRLEGEAELGSLDLDDFRHSSRCWTCWPPRPRMSSQWCVHPRELWNLREKKPEALDLGQLVSQIEALEKAQDALIPIVPEAARELIARRLWQMIEIARAVKKEQARG